MVVMGEGEDKLGSGVGVGELGRLAVVVSMRGCRPRDEAPMNQSLAQYKI